MRPSSLSLSLTALGAVLAFTIALLAPAFWWLWLAYACALAGLLVFDALRLPTLEWRWSLPDQLYLGHEAPLVVQVRNPGRGVPLSLRLDGQSEDALRAIDAQTATIASGGVTDISLPLTAWRRGQGRVEWLALEWRSKLGLVVRRRRRPVLAPAIHVLPDLRAVQEAGLRAQNSKQYLQGLKVQRHIGDGREFDALREFQQGHDTRAIDWRTSARTRTLHVREYREERNHNIVAAIDCGRLMSRNLGPIARIDHALNASLHLAYASLRAGDRVGLMGFDQEQRFWLAPQHGRGALQRFVDATEALPYTLNVTDFRSACMQLDSKLKRRSVIIFFTELESRRQGEALAAALHILAKKHILVVVAVGEGDISPVAAQPIERAEDIETTVMAARLAGERDAALRALSSRGIRTINAPPERLAVQLLNLYHDVKRRGVV